MITGTDQMFQQYNLKSKYPDLEELSRSLDVSDGGRMRILNSYEAIEASKEAAGKDHDEIISTILASLTQQQKLEYTCTFISEEDTSLLHLSAFHGSRKCAMAILSHLSREQQWTLLHKRDSDGYTPADCASLSRDEETKKVLRKYKQKCMYHSSLGPKLPTSLGLRT